VFGQQPKIIANTQESARLSARRRIRSDALCDGGKGWRHPFEQRQ
jgi:hypothetical protein